MRRAPALALAWIGRGIYLRKPALHLSDGVGEPTLIELVGPLPGDDLNIDYPTSIVEECPLGTETTRPVAEMRARLNAYAKESDSEFIESLPKPASVLTLRVMRHDLGR